jgi:hypothetical protein
MKIFTSIIKVGPGSWTYTWAAGIGPYRVIEDGIIQEEQWADTSYTVHGTDAEEPPILEVCEQDETVPSEEYPIKPTMQWFGNPDATLYKIYKEGVFFDSVPETGKGYYPYSGFPRQADGALLNVTLTQMDEMGNESEAMAFKWLTFRYPDAPLTTITLNPATGEFTIDAR